MENFPLKATELDQSIAGNERNSNGDPRLRQNDVAAISPFIEAAISL
jgi:hypothetical protein